MTRQFIEIKAFLERPWGRGSILSASSWPGLSRPFTSWQIENKDMDARVKPGHDEFVRER